MQAAIDGLNCRTRRRTAGGLDLAQAAVAANPSDLQARQDLAMALFASGDNAGAMADLESIRIDRSWNEEAARIQLLNFSKHWVRPTRCDDR